MVPQGAALAALVSAHYEAILSFYGTDLGLRMARKHLGWYLDAAGAQAHRPAMLTATDPALVLALIDRAFTDAERLAA